MASKRFRNALRVLRGQIMTPQQQRADWDLMRLEQLDMMDRLSALLARMSKREKGLARSAIDRLAPEQATQPELLAPNTPEARKAAVRRRVAQVQAARHGVVPEFSGVTAFPPEPAQEETA